LASTDFTVQIGFPKGAQSLLGVLPQKIHLLRAFFHALGSGAGWEGEKDYPSLCLPCSPAQITC